MDIKEIINRNYQATVKRGLITTETPNSAFVEKMYEEVNEFYIEPWRNKPAELADIILVCFAYAKHFNIDILQELEKKTLYNETR